jgi:hypothetical protein
MQAIASTVAEALRARRRRSAAEDIIVILPFCFDPAALKGAIVVELPRLCVISTCDTGVSNRDLVIER